ncbi:hypothetical protein OZX67_00065 [Bifidobacterium sp. ESL0728]|uniref:hypothetical protein n=1 Tax=Bifidobacterium sp. ESL0728 TaxID=2983220 RepID=UPI0023F87B64|nr:hypothetical protein [Bifidobacterium sp. ESL0728]WEV59021.1 hypothetical protein OZX67_00065 [Bifidobacterium sp. ESL0728]
MEWNNILILDNAIEIQLPESYKPIVATGEFPVAQKESISLYQNVNDESEIQKNPKIDERNTHFVDDAVSLVAELPDTEAFHLNEETYIAATLRDQPWRNNATKSLNVIFQLIAGVLPDTQMIQSVTKHYSLPGKDNTHVGKDIGMINYVTNIEEHPMYNAIIMLPAHGQEAIISMTSSTEHLLARAMEFNHIADSIQLLEPDPPANTEPDSTEDTTK